MPDKPIATLDLNKWIDQMAILMAEMAFKVIDKQAGDKGVEVQKALSLAFVSRMVSATVRATLEHRPDHIKTKKEMSDYNVNAFSEIKVATQEAVSLAFTDAMSAYAGVLTDYYCAIKLVPPAPSKGFQ